MSSRRPTLVDELQDELAVYLAHTHVSDVPYRAACFIVDRLRAGGISDVTIRHTLVTEPEAKSDTQAAV